ncbi:MAG: iron-sulfur cluster assembly scaffold protein [Desulfobacterales bacterium]|nr:iron-sulfur cluster assembly scaffold protein [Desulfobacterales bacterium]
MTSSNNGEFDFWNDHSLEFLEMAMKRDHQETVLKCHGRGSASRECGDRVTFYLNVEGSCLSAISYDLSGCLFSHACANTLIQLARGKSPAEARQIKAQEIIDYLKTLPQREYHCAHHVLKAFFLALDDLDS